MHCNGQAKVSGKIIQGIWIIIKGDNTHGGGFLPFLFGQARAWDSRAAMPGQSMVLTGYGLMGTGLPENIKGKAEGNYGNDSQ